MTPTWRNDFSPMRMKGGGHFISWLGRMPVANIINTVNLINYDFRVVLHKNYDSKVVLTRKFHTL